MSALFAFVPSRFSTAGAPASGGAVLFLFGLCAAIIIIWVLILGKSRVLSFGEYPRLSRS